MWSTGPLAANLTARKYESFEGHKLLGLLEIAVQASPCRHVAVQVLSAQVFQHVSVGTNKKAREVSSQERRRSGLAFCLAYLCTFA